MQASYTFRFFILVLVILLPIFYSVAIGAVIGIVNSNICPGYFTAIINLPFDQNIVHEVVIKGIQIGMLYGICFTTIVTSVYFRSCRGKLSMFHVLNYLQKSVTYVAIYWFIGGVLSVMMVLLSPDFYYQTFYIPIIGAEVLRYAWVSGSLWGVLVGGCLVLLIIPLQLIKEPTVPDDHIISD